MRALRAALGLLVTGCLDAPPGSLDHPDDAAPGGFRKALQIQGGAVAAPLADFPLLVRLEGDADLTAHASDGGLDVVFRDQDGGLLPFEVEAWARASGALRAWVTLPAIAESMPTTFYVHYGDGIEQDRSDASATWKSGFAAVWHLDEEPDEEIDSTGGGHDAVGSNGSAARAPGFLGDGARFDGSNDYLDFGSDLPAEVDHGAALTVTAWVRYDALGQWSHFISKARTSSNSFGWALGIDGGYDFMLRTMNGNVNARGSSGQARPAVGDWHHWALVYDGAQGSDAERLRGFRDGVEYVLTYQAVIPSTFDAQDGPLYIGCAPWNTPEYCIEGVVDEVHIAPVVRPPEWIAAEFASQAAGAELVVVGAEEAL